MAKLKMFSQSNQSNKIGEFIIDNYNIDVLFDNDVYKHSMFLYLGEDNSSTKTKYVICVDSDFLELYSKEPEIAICMCAHEVGHIATNSISLNKSLDDEKNADEYAYARTNKKDMINMFKTTIDYTKNKSDKRDPNYETGIANLRERKRNIDKKSKDNLLKKES